MGELGGRPKCYQRHVGQAIGCDNDTHSIDMATDDVSTELIADFQGAFEINASSRLPASDRRDAQRLGTRIGGEPAAVAVLATRHDSEAHTAAGDRGTDDNAGRIVAACDGKAHKILPRAARPP